MEKVLDKLNNYDLWVVMFPGIICTMTVTIIYKWGYIGLFSFDFLNSFGSTVAFIVISYFVGIILQEIGSVTQQKIFFRKGVPAEIFLSNKSKVLSEKEKNLFIKLVKKDYSIEFNASSTEECRIIFNYINTYLVLKGLSEKSDKMQAIFGLSRGLFSSFLINTIGIIIILIFFNINFKLYNMIVCLIVCMISLVLLYHRTLRYAEIRVSTLYQSYYISSTKDD